MTRAGGQGAAEILGAKVAGWFRPRPTFVVAGPARVQQKRAAEEQFQVLDEISAEVIGN